MIEIVSFFVAGGAIGYASAWLHRRQSSTLAVVCGLYGVALAVCFVIGHLNQVGIMTFVQPYVLVALAASLWSASLAMYWPAIAERAVAWNPWSNRDLAA